MINRGMTPVDQILIQAGALILITIDVGQYSSELAALVFVSLNVDRVETIKPIDGVSRGSLTRSLFNQILGTSLGSVYPEEAKTSFVMNVETDIDHGVDSVTVDYS